MHKGIDVKRSEKLRWLVVAMAVVLMALMYMLSGCGGSGNESGAGGTAAGSSAEGSSSSGKAASVLGSGSKTLRILSGSENKELEPIIEKYAKKNHVKVEMAYQGSLDIMRQLGQEDFAYDAVWPASSIWLNAGDTLHRVKHAESICQNPVVFGIRKSLAEELGFVDKEVSVNDILDAIMAGKLKFCMTSATQSNSGASAYIGFIHALLGGPDVITSEDLKNQDMQKKLAELLSGIDRSSGSSDWLKDMFLKGDYDAMVNYECLMITADEQLVAAKKEPLYVVYPYDGLSIADSPLGYVDQGDDKAEELFLDFQEYLLSDDTQDRIQQTGRRTAYTGISDKNKVIFKKEWGLQPDRVLSPFKMPDAKVLDECLNLYQAGLRKPSLTVYCLDYSGSMMGEGNEQLVAAMEQVLIQKNAEKNYLQASPNDVTLMIPFSSGVLDTWTAEGNGPELEALYDKVKEEMPTGGTDMYEALEKGLEMLNEYDISKYTTAFIVMTDGESEDYFDDFQQAWKDDGRNIPVFSIMYGDADSSQLDQLAQLTNARAFDGREDLTGAFRKVRGYN